LDRLVPFDKWYTHHPNWIVTNETDDPLPTLKHILFLI